MPEINNTDKFRSWLRTCPSIAKSKYFGADYIGESATQYAVISVPSQLRYKDNIWGERAFRQKQEQNFVFAAKAPYGSDTPQNLDNLGFFQDVATWIYEQNKAGNFPEWDGGIITAIEVQNTGAPIQVGPDSARYQFQIKVYYNLDEGV